MWLPAPPCSMYSGTVDQPFACEPPQIWLKKYDGCSRLLRACLSLSCLAIHSLPFYRILVAKQSLNIVELQGPWVLPSLGLSLWRFCLQEVHESCGECLITSCNITERLVDASASVTLMPLCIWFGVLTDQAGSMVLIVFHWSLHAWIAGYSCLKVEKQSVS